VIDTSAYSPVDGAQAKDALGNQVAPGLKYEGQNEITNVA
jgi:hypothetical protein